MIKLLHNVCFIAFLITTFAGASQAMKSYDSTVNWRGACKDAYVLNPFFQKHGFPLLGECANVVNSIGHRGLTPLLCAAQDNEIAVARLLIKHGADVDFLHSMFGSALHYAVSNRNVEMVRLLLQKGANPDVAAPLRRAVWRSDAVSREIIKMLCDAGAHYSCIVLDFRSVAMLNLPGLLWHAARNSKLGCCRKPVAAS